MTDSNTDTDPESTDGMTISRRGLFAALIGAGMGALGAKGVAETTEADAQGGIGTPSDPLEGVYAAEIRGPITDAGPVQDLVNIRVAEVGETVNAGPDTLIIRYQP
jgi:hypothetical protein